MIHEMTVSPGDRAALRAAIEALGIVEELALLLAACEGGLSAYAYGRGLDRKDAKRLSEQCRDFLWMRSGFMERTAYLESRALNRQARFLVGLPSVRPVVGLDPTEDQTR